MGVTAGSAGSPQKHHASEVIVTSRLPWQIKVGAYWLLFSLDYYGTSYFGPWTYAWPAGYQMTLTVDATASDGGRDYVFSAWSTGETTEALTILTNYCGYAGSCPVTSINALYNEVGATPLRVPHTATPMRSRPRTTGPT